MPRLLKELRIDDVSSVDRGAGEGVRVLLLKRADALYNKPLTFGRQLPDEVEQYLKREFSDKERQNAADSGAALPDGSFPIKNKQDLKNAIQAIGRAKDPAKAKAHIKSRARALGATDLIPENWSKRAEVIDFSAARRSVGKGDDFDAALGNIESRDDAQQCLSEVSEAIYALNMSIGSILDDEEAGDKPAAIAESFAQFQSHIAGLEVGKQDKETDMTTLNADVQKKIDEAVAAAVAKTMEGANATIAKLSTDLVIAKMSEKHKAYHDSLPSEAEKKKFQAMSPDERDGEMDKMKKRAEDDPIYKQMRSENEDLRKRLEKIEGERELEVCKREAKEMGITRADAGQLLQKVKKGDAEALTEWNKVVTETAKKLTASREEALRMGKVFDELGDGRAANPDHTGDAVDSLTQKAAELRKQKPELTEAQAFEKVMLDPANADLAKREREQRMNRINKVAA